MANIDYWRETLIGALEGCGAPEVLTTKQIESVAQALLTSRECESMYTGADCIPHPLEAEIEELKKRHAIEIKELESQVHTYRHSVAVRRHVRDEDVSLQDGRVMVLLDG